MMRKSMIVLAVVGLLAGGVSSAAAAGASDLAVMDAVDTTGVGAVVGATHSQSVTVLNNGPDGSSQGVVTVTASSGQQLSPSPSTSYSCTSKLLATVLTCTFGTLDVSVAQQLSWTVKYTTAGAKTVTIQVSGPNADPNTANNTALIATPAASSDLAVTDAEDSTGGPAYIDAPHSQSIVVRDLGPDDSPKTVATVTASSGQQLTAGASGSYSCSSNFPKTQLTCTFPDLSSGGAIVLHWTAKYTAVGAKTVTVKVSGPNADPNASNNTGVITTPAASSDLAVTDATDLTGGPAFAGATHEQGALIWNHGPDFSRRTVITITANSGQQLSAPGAGCTLSLGKNILTCTVIDFDSGSAFGMYWFVKYTSGGAKTVTIKVTGENADPTAANNTGVINTPAATSDLAVADATDITGGPALVGATHQQGSTIANLGPHLSPKIVVTITASSGQQLGAVSPGCTLNLTKNVLTCTYTNVGSGISFGLFWSVKYTGGGARTVTIKVSGPNSDPNASNNAAAIQTAG
jgi:ribosomal protein S10